jgi:hypothetical protein
MTDLPHASLFQEDHAGPPGQHGQKKYYEEPALIRSLHGTTSEDTLHGAGPIVDDL